MGTARRAVPSIKVSTWCRARRIDTLIHRVLFR